MSSGNPFQRARKEAIDQLIELANECGGFEFIMDNGKVSDFVTIASAQIGCSQIKAREYFQIALHAQGMLDALKKLSSTKKIEKKG